MLQRRRARRCLARGLQGHRQALLRALQAPALRPRRLRLGRAAHRGARSCRCSVVGAEEIYPLVGNVPSLARLLGSPTSRSRRCSRRSGRSVRCRCRRSGSSSSASRSRSTVRRDAADDPMLVFNLTDQVRETIQPTLYPAADEAGVRLPLTAAARPREGQGASGSTTSPTPSSSGSTTLSPVLDGVLRGGRRLVAQHLLGQVAHRVAAVGATVGGQRRSGGTAGRGRAVPVAFIAASGARLRGRGAMGVMTTGGAVLVVAGEIESVGKGAERNIGGTSSMPPPQSGQAAAARSSICLRTCAACSRDVRTEEGSAAPRAEGVFHALRGEGAQLGHRVAVAGLGVLVQQDVGGVVRLGGEDRRG